MGDNEIPDLIESEDEGMDDINLLAPDTIPHQESKIDTMLPVHLPPISPHDSIPAPFQNTGLNGYDNNPDVPVVGIAMDARPIGGSAVLVNNSPFQVAAGAFGMFTKNEDTKTLGVDFSDFEKYRLAEEAFSQAIIDWKLRERLERRQQQPEDHNLRFLFGTDAEFQFSVFETEMLEWMRQNSGPQRNNDDSPPELAPTRDDSIPEPNQDGPVSKITGEGLKNILSSRGFNVPILLDHKRKIQDDDIFQVHEHGISELKDASEKPETDHPLSLFDQVVSKLREDALQFSVAAAESEDLSVLFGSADTDDDDAAELKQPQLIRQGSLDFECVQVDSEAQVRALNDADYPLGRWAFDPHGGSRDSTGGTAMRVVRHRDQQNA